MKKKINKFKKKNKIKNIISENKSLKKEIKNIKLNKQIINNGVKLDKKIINNEVKLDEKIINNEIKLDEKIINNEIKLDEKIVDNTIKIDNDKNILKTTIHDIMTIQSSLNNINLKFNNKILTLTGDLGYLSNKKYNYNENEVQLYLKNKIFGKICKNKS